MKDLELLGKTLLVVDDEADLREIVASELEYMGARVFQAENVSAAKLLLQAESLDLIISDIRMPGGTGIDLLSFIKKQNLNIPPIILITGFADLNIEDALNQGAEAILSKPFKLEELFRVVVRLTTPDELRYSFNFDCSSKDLSFNFQDDFIQMINNHEIAVGRGGVALSINSKHFKWNTGDVFKFDFKFKDEEFLGTAICRWWKSNEQSNRGTLGLEFLQLSDKTLQFFHEYWGHHKIIPFIPSLG